MARDPGGRNAAAAEATDLALCNLRVGQVLVMIMAKIRRPFQRADKCGQLPGICMPSAPRTAARLQPAKALSPR